MAQAYRLWILAHHDHRHDPCMLAQFSFSTLPCLILSFPKPKSQNHHSKIERSGNGLVRSWLRIRLTGSMTKGRKALTKRHLRIGTKWLNSCRKSWKTRNKAAFRCFVNALRPSTE